MKKVIEKIVVVGFVSVMAVAVSGCYGPFQLTTRLHDWNGQVSQSKFVNELVFLGLCILPVYELCVLGDGLIFNSIEFWGGSNPIAMKDGEVEESEMRHEGQMYKVVKSKNSMSIALVNSDLKVDFKYDPQERAWYQMDGEKQVKVVDVKGNKVFAYLPGQKTLAFDAETAHMIEAEVMASRGE